MGSSKNETYASFPEVNKKQLSDVAMSKALPSDKIWWIHGNAYDLTRFVEHHPGGKESILLGRGRDCTALFESYHIFNKDHWKVLDKFCVVKNHKLSERKRDAFYEILKDRVSTVLKEKGIDPVNDRGATVGRTIHYVVIFAAWLVSGHSHIKGSVIGSFFFCCFWMAYGSTWARCRALCC